MAHIMGAVPVDLESAELGRLRLNCIKELCGKSIHWSTLVIQELSDGRDVLLKSGRDTGSPMWIHSGLKKPTLHLNSPATKIKDVGIVFL